MKGPPEGGLFSFSDKSINSQALHPTIERAFAAHMLSFANRTRYVQGLSASAVCLLFAWNAYAQSMWIPDPQLLCLNITKNDASKLTLALKDDIGRYIVRNQSADDQCQNNPKSKPDDIAFEVPTGLVPWAIDYLNEKKIGLTGQYVLAAAAGSGHQVRVAPGTLFSTRVTPENILGKRAEVECKLLTELRKHFQHVEFRECVRRQEDLCFSFHIISHTLNKKYAGFSLEKLDGKVRRGFWIEAKGFIYGFPYVDPFSRRNFETIQTYVQENSVRLRSSETFDGNPLIQEFNEIGTYLKGSNADGWDSLLEFVIGKSINPRALKSCPTPPKL
jgi:hypothetical protein